MPGAPHPALRLYSLCKSTRWTHLPLAGGWYDQSPRLIDHFEIIMAVEAQVQKRKQSDEERKAKRQRSRIRGH